MRITVFGATGATGREVVAQALRSGHQVTAFARNPSSLEPRRGLTIVAGQTDEPSSVERVIVGNEAVVCALGGRPWRRRERVCSTAARTLIPMMEKHGLRRLVAISTFGAGTTRQQVGWLARTLLFGIALRSEVTDKEAMEEELSRTNLDWIVVRVGLLTDGPPRGTYRVADDGSIRGMGKIARADVAAFILTQLESQSWVRRRPAIMY